MARQKLSEFKAKQILLSQLGQDYSGFSLHQDNVAALASKLSKNKLFVLKVDQGVKKRGKQGLLKLKLKPQEIATAAAELFAKGYDQLVLEEFLVHAADSEQYLSLERVRGGWRLLHSRQGGIEVEEHAESVKQYLWTSVPQEQEKIANKTGLNLEFLQQLISAAGEQQFSLLEINPLVVGSKGNYQFLDLAVEVDTSGEYFVNTWQSIDFVFPPSQARSEEEVAVAELASKSQASLSLKLLNPAGSVWMLLSGGGASIVLADELANLGLGQEIGNYGEYSGNPNQEETMIYATQVLQLLLKSPAKAKRLLIAGGVANFTDVRVTFRGILDALQPLAAQLRAEGVKVYVRRGGPFQAEGLRMIAEFLERESLAGTVVGPEVALTEVVSLAMQDRNNG